MPTDTNDSTHASAAPLAASQAGVVSHSKRGILFTAFEPSGDDHAASVIAELRTRHPDLPIFAWGGPKMEAAGASMVATTVHSAVMGVPGLAKILEHRRTMKDIKAWLANHPVALHVPVDSPAANFPICKITRAAGTKIVHLVAPQLWAWGSWRLKKLRRLTDHVLCLLPFEEEWFLTRGIKATFIGHPLFDEPIDMDRLDEQVHAIEKRFKSQPDPSAAPAEQPAEQQDHARDEDASVAGKRLALMPGSRPGEIASSLPVIVDAFRRLRADFPDVRGVIAATNERVARAMRDRMSEIGGCPDGLIIVEGQTDAVIRWCDFALVVSGTVTLQVARQVRPMITFYTPHRLQYILGRMLVSTPHFTLPNLVAGSRVIPELIPHFGDGEDLAIGIIRLMRQPGYADDQRAGLKRVVSMFAGKRAAAGAADAIEAALGLASHASAHPETPATATTPAS